MARTTGGVISNFIVQAMQGKPMTIYGDGRQTRSFCFVDDLIEGLIRMMDQNETLGPINLGNPVESSMLDLAQAVLSLTGSKSQLQFVPLPQDDPKQRCPDIGKAQKILGWAAPRFADGGLVADDRVLPFGAGEGRPFLSASADRSCEPLPICEGIIPAGGAGTRPDPATRVVSLLIGL